MKSLRTSILLLTCLVPAGYLLAQDAEEADSSRTDSSSSEEVEYSEDNYRQFMELRDANRDQGVFPETSFQPQLNNQKIDKLPEASQKHLRDQLREIILMSDEWQEGDENTQHPYVPSDAARSDTELVKQESEAWRELVGDYQLREAQNYAEGFESGSRPGGGQQGQSDSAQQNGQQSSAGEQAGEHAESQSEPAAGEAAQQADASQQGEQSASEGAGESSSDSSKENDAEQSEESKKNQQVTEDSYQPIPDDSKRQIRNEGVSQNAMEFLLNQGNKSAGSADGTIAIKDLKNAKGIGSDIQPGNEDKAEETKDGDDNDGDSRR